MELRHIRYFVAVAEELNFTRAAGRLGIGHPNLHPISTTLTALPHFAWSRASRFSRQTTDLAVERSLSHPTMSGLISEAVRSELSSQSSMLCAHPGDRLSPRKVRGSHVDGRYPIGGYQILKKWLSYRAQPLLSRPLVLGEVTYVRDVAQRLAALRLFGPELDENYAACAEDSYSWPRLSPASPALAPAVTSDT